MTVTLYKIMMACGDYYIDECPMDLKGLNWVAVQTYKGINFLDGKCRYKPDTFMTLHPSAILAFITIRDCEVVE